MGIGNRRVLETNSIWVKQGSSALSEILQNENRTATGWVIALQSWQLSIPLIAESCFTIELLLTLWAVHNLPQKGPFTMGKAFTPLASMPLGSILGLGSGNVSNLGGRGHIFEISRLLMLRFGQSTACFKAKNLYFQKICEIFLSRNCLRPKFAKFLCRENFLLYSSPARVTECWHFSSPARVTEYSHFNSSFTFQ